MSLLEHVNQISSKHAKIENELHTAYINHIDDIIIGKLKKQKLKLKDELQYYVESRLLEVI
ncbi:hypothetical protein NOVO_01580 [Rickettsiales bacterium Ac37b]|nr:hypothetical protein NOVO_01580 [Rickettsiales bacterium Ac37b]